MLETYSNATIANCTFIKNKATDNGGAIYCRRRSQLIIRHSHLQANNAWSSGGSILVQHSLAIITFSTFEDDISIMGYGGSISVERVGDVTIDNCQFINCTAPNGGSVSVRAESVLIAKENLFDQSFSNSCGGGLYISKSVLRGFNVILRNSGSDLGGGIFVSDLSEITIKEFRLEINKAEKSGGTVYCKQSEIIFEEGKKNSIMPKQVEVLCSLNIVK